MLIVTDVSLRLPRKSRDSRPGGRGASSRHPAAGAPPRVVTPAHDAPWAVAYLRAMSIHHSTTGAQAGDRIEARGLHGEAPRRGEILEILGEPGHERYRVRWDDRHESIIFPADGVSVLPGAARASRAQA
jgi:hypothetical protein